MDVTLVTDLSNDLHVHKTGCRDIARDIARYQGTGRTYGPESGMELKGVTTRAEVARDWWSDIINDSDENRAQPDSYWISFVDFKPCTEGLA